MTSQIPPTQVAAFKSAEKDVLKLRLAEQELCSYWSVIFSRKGVETLTKQDMTGFLSYAQNKRWKEISNDTVTGDMERLRQALLVLIDESRPLADRLNEIEPGRGAKAVPHLGKAKLTPILLVTNPRKYGVWNDYSERALRGMGIFPEFEPGWHLGEQYEAVNNVLRKLAEENKLSMWWLDIILEKISRLVR